MAGTLTELNEVLSTDESQIEENILCPTACPCSVLYFNATPEFFRREEQNKEGKLFVVHRVMLDNLWRSMLSFPTDNYRNECHLMSFSQRENSEKDSRGLSHMPPSIGCNSLTNCKTMSQLQHKTMSQELHLYMIKSNYFVQNNQRYKLQQHFQTMFLRYSFTCC